MDPDVDVPLTVRTLDGREYSLLGNPRKVQGFLSDSRAHSLSSVILTSAGNPSDRSVLIFKSAIISILAPEGFWTVSL